MIVFHPGSIRSSILSFPGFSEVIRPTTGFFVQGDSVIQMLHAMPQQIETLNRKIAAGRDFDGAGFFDDRIPL